MSETVTINGILYDAVTGLPVEGTSKHNVRVIRSDQKLARKVVGERIVLKKSPVTVEPVIPRKRQPVKLSSTRHHDAMAKVKKPQKSLTLNRRYVTKPVEKIHVSAPRATAVAKHPEVSHFNNGKPLPNPVKLPVKSPQSTPKPKSAAVTTPKNLMSDIRRVVSKPKPLAAKPAPTKALPLEEVDRVFSEVTESISREFKRDVVKIKKSPKSFYIITAIVVAILIAGIIAVFSLPQIEMLIASRYAGIDGHLPAYIAPGYGIKGSVNYSADRVQIKYRNDRQSEEYTVIESATTEPDRELVIGGNSAIFVKSGIRYQITYSALSDEQIRRVADSL